MCALVPYKDTLSVSAYWWKAQFTPNGDICNGTTPPSMAASRDLGGAGVFDPWLTEKYSGALFDCSYEEQIDLTSANSVRWYEVGPSTTLFHIGEDAFLPADYSPAFTQSKSWMKTYSFAWGRGPEIVKAQTITTYNLLNIGTPASSSLAGQRMVIPRHITIALGYYQVRKGLKRLIKGTELGVSVGEIHFDANTHCHTLTNGGALQSSIEASGITQCPLNQYGRIASSYYQLEIVLQPVSYLFLFNRFAFTQPIYQITFLLSGLITIGLAYGIYWFQRLLTRVRRPVFHGWPLWVAVVQPQLIGCVTGAFAPFLGVFVTYLWFQKGDLKNGGKICSDGSLTATPSALCLENITDWQGTYNHDQLLFGRKGNALVAIAWYSMYMWTQLVIPKWSADDVKPDVVRAAEHQKKMQERAKRLKNKGRETKKKKVERTEDDDDEKVEQGDLWQPAMWRRATIMINFLFGLALCTVHIELSYSPPFAANVNEFVVITKIFYQIYEEMMIKVRPAHLSNLHLVSCLISFYLFTFLFLSPPFQMFSSTIRSLLSPLIRPTWQPWVPPLLWVLLADTLSGMYTRLDAPLR